jgi:diguanylate cyclase (GGDEF)-like protein/PAS domain S-box-containing protein/putative nucleotidyltransferase with HDIG domain
MENMMITLEHGSVRGVEYSLIRADGSEFPGELSASVLKNASGNPVGFIAITSDITERKRVEEALIRLSNAVRMSTDSIVITDLGVTIVEVNKATLRMYGTDNERDLVGTNALDLIAPEDREKALSGMHEVLEKGYNENREYHIVTKDGGRVLVAMSSAIMKGVDGKPTGFVAVSRDITERKRAEERIAHLNSVLLAIRNVNQLVSKENDRDRLLQGACDALIETRGYYNAWIALIDESLGLVTTAEAGLNEEFLPLVEQLKRGELTACGRRALEQSGVVITEDPSSTCADCPLAEMYTSRGAMTSLLEHAGKVYGLLSTSIPAQFTANEEEHALFQELAGDISFALHSIELEEERKRAEEAVRQSEERYRQLVSGLQDAYTILQEGKIVFANEKLAEMSGYDLRELISMDMARLWPPHLRKRAEALFEQVRRGETLPERMEGRILNKNGVIVPVEVSHKSFDYEGKPSISLLFRDITERKRAQDKIERHAKREETLHTIATAVSQSPNLVELLDSALEEVLKVMGLELGAVFVVDETSPKLAVKAYRGFSHEAITRVETIEFTAAEMERATALGQSTWHWDELLTEDHLAPVIGAIAGDGVQSCMSIPLRAKRALHGAMVIASRAACEFSPDDIELLDAIGNEIAVGIENARLLEKTRELSIADELTGLYNHRHFYEVLATEMDRTKRYSHSFSLVVLDLDGFKKYNDNFGHTNGDAILRSFAQTLKSTLRKSDTAFRYGGDEFTIILPATDVDKATRVVDRIRSKWSQVGKAQNIFLETPPGFSAGIAEFPGNAETADGLVFLADAALYRSKRQGGHKTTLVSDLGALTRDVMDTQTLDQIYALSATVEAKDPYTYGHSKGVAAISEMIGKALGLSREELANLHAAGLLHDIGKVGVSDTILTKPSKPTEDEWEVLRKHSAEGARIVDNVKELAPLVPMIRHHHEWYDGTGYPGGLKGEDIPIGARILSIADAYDTLTTQRTYRDVVSQAEALEELRRCSGTQFDPELVEAFCRAMDETMRQD